MLEPLREFERYSESVTLFLRAGRNCPKFLVLEFWCLSFTASNEYADSNSLWGALEAYGQRQKTSGLLNRQGGFRTMKSGKKSYLAQVRPSRTITSRINSKNRNRIRMEFSGSASHRPRCLPDRWPESYSPRQETRRPQRPYSFPWAKRASSLAARHEPPRPTACRRPAASPSHRSPAPRRRRPRPDRHLGMSGRGLPCRCLRFQTAKGKHNSEGNK